MTDTDTETLLGRHDGAVRAVSDAFGDGRAFDEFFMPVIRRAAMHTLSLSVSVGTDGSKRNVGAFSFALEAARVAVNVARTRLFFESEPVHERSSLERQAVFVLAVNVMARVCARAHRQTTITYGSAIYHPGTLVTVSEWIGSLEGFREGPWVIPEAKPVSPSQTPLPLSEELALHTAILVPKMLFCHFDTRAVSLLCACSPSPESSREDTFSTVRTRFVGTADEVFKAVVAGFDGGDVPESQPADERRVPETPVYNGSQDEKQERTSREPSLSASDAAEPDPEEKDREATEDGDDFANDTATVSLPDNPEEKGDSPREETEPAGEPKEMPGSPEDRFLAGLAPEVRELFETISESTLLPSVIRYVTFKEDAVEMPFTVFKIAGLSSDIAKKILRASPVLLSETGSRARFDVRIRRYFDPEKP